MRLSKEKVTISVQIGKAEKEQFERVCKPMGLNISDVMNIFVRKVVSEQAIPFDVKLESNIVAETKEKQIQDSRYNSEQQAGKKILSLMDIRERHLRELQGRPHLPIDLRNCKWVYEDIGQIYFFGLRVNRDEILRWKWE